MTGPGWWVIHGEALLGALRSVAAGESPDVVYLELLANSTTETVDPDDGWSLMPPAEPD